MNPDDLQQQQMLYTLRYYQNHGCQIALGGKPAYPQKVVNACFRENSSYMAEYIADDSGRIRKINFIRIRSD